MSDFNIIDRRQNHRDKSLPNRQRFLDRVKGAVRNSAKRQMSDRKLTDESDANVTVPTDGIREPQFQHDPDTGIYDIVIPGNKKHNVGDEIMKPRGGGGGRGSEGSADGDGEDEFQFALSYEEYLNIILDDVELPDMVKASEKHTVLWEKQRAGFSHTGMPSNLNVERTMIAGIGRRIALKYPKLARIKELEAELATCEDEDRRAAIEAEIESLRVRANAITFLDDVDLRYNNFTRVPKPMAQAVMFCILDVSGSMGEMEKMIAKKFFILLNVFLKRKYKFVDVVFVRHTHEAKVVDEDTFFTDRETGGTVVSTAYTEVLKEIKARYPADDWNIYVAQASDGDNMYSDAPTAEKALREIMGFAQYFTYVEIVNRHQNGDSSVWGSIKTVNREFPNMAYELIQDETQVVRVFRSLFSKEKKA